MEHFYKEKAKMQMVHLHTASAAWHPEKVGPQGAVNKWCWLRWREKASSLQLLPAVSLPVLSPMSYPQSRSGGGQQGKPCLSPESRAPREQQHVLWSCAQPSLTREVLLPHSLPQESTSTSWPLAKAGNMGVETKRYSGSRGISPHTHEHLPRAFFLCLSPPLPRRKWGGGGAMDPA